MFPLKQKLNNKGDTLSIANLRQQLRKKLTEIGMKINDPEQKSFECQSRERSCGRRVEEENLPVLHPFQSNKIIINEFRQVFSDSYHQLYTVRQAKKSLTKEIIHGVQYNYQNKMSRDPSPKSFKNMICRKILREARSLSKEKSLLRIDKQKYELKTPMQVAEKQSSIRIVQPLNLINMVQRLNMERNKPRRSKTQEKEVLQEKARKASVKFKKTVYFDITPWERGAARETQVAFN